MGIKQIIGGIVLLSLLSCSTRLSVYFPIREGSFWEFKSEEKTFLLTGIEDTVIKNERVLSTLMGDSTIFFLVNNDLYKFYSPEINLNGKLYHTEGGFLLYLPENIFPSLTWKDSINEQLFIDTSEVSISFKLKGETQKEENLDFLGLKKIKTLPVNYTFFIYLNDSLISYEEFTWFFAKDIGPVKLILNNKTYLIDSYQF